MSTDHNPILNIFQMEPDDGSIQAGPPYRCVECGGDVILKGRSVPVHAEPRPVLTGTEER